MSKNKSSTEHIHSHAEHILEAARRQMKGTFGPASDGPKLPKPPKKSS